MVDTRIELLSSMSIVALCRRLFTVLACISLVFVSHYIPFNEPPLSMIRLKRGWEISEKCISKSCPLRGGGSGMLSVQVFSSHLLRARYSTALLFIVLKILKIISSANYNKINVNSHSSISGCELHYQL